MITADVTMEFACSDEEMVAERIESVRFDRHGVAHDILSVEPGRIPEGHDQCNLADYRRTHGLEDYTNDPRWAAYVPDGCVSYVARVRLRDLQGGDMTRDRVIAIPFGDRDLGFSIDRIGEAD